MKNHWGIWGICVTVFIGGIAIVMTNDWVGWMLIGLSIVWLITAYTIWGIQSHWKFNKKQDSTQETTGMIWPEENKKKKRK